MVDHQFGISRLWMRKIVEEIEMYFYSSVLTDEKPRMNGEAENTTLPQSMLQNRFQRRG